MKRLCGNVARDTGIGKEGKRNESRELRIKRWKVEKMIVVVVIGVIGFIFLSLMLWSSGWFNKDK